MAVKKSSEQTHEKILESALIVFSEKGYSSATIRDISTKAGCNSVTVFRHFEDKMSLFLQVIERYHTFTFDREELDARMGYLNLHKDFRTMASYFFDRIYQHIHILRIFINDGHIIEPILKYIWFVPDEMKNFVEGYLLSMYPDRMPQGEAVLLSEMFCSFVVRTCLRINVHDGIDENSRQIAADAKKTMDQSVNMIVSMVLMRIREQGA